MKSVLVKAAVEAAVILLPTVSGAADGRQGHTVSDDPGTACIVNTAVAFVRQAPDYESPLETQLLMGTEVRVDSAVRYWRHIISSDPPYKGWVNEMVLSGADADGFLPAGEDATAGKYPKGTQAQEMICTAPYSGIYEGRSRSSRTVGNITLGCIICMTGARGRAAHVILPDGKEGWMDRDALSSREGLERTAGKAVGTALQLIGTPYLWGGNSASGLDCSGLVWLSYRMAGTRLPRNASQQALCGRKISGAGAPDLKAMLPGDLIAFGNPGSSKVRHIGLYLGDGKFIHSSQKVQISSLRPEDTDFYSSKEVLAVRRILE